MTPPDTIGGPTRSLPVRCTVNVGSAPVVHVHGVEPVEAGHVDGRADDGGAAVGRVADTTRVDRATDPTEVVEVQQVPDPLLADLQDEVAADHGGRGRPEVEVLVVEARPRLRGEHVQRPERRRQPDHRVRVPEGVARGPVAGRHEQAAVGRHRRARRRPDARLALVRHLERVDLALPRRAGSRARSRGSRRSLRTGRRRARSPGPSAMVSAPRCCSTDGSTSLGSAGSDHSSEPSSRFSANSLWCTVDSNTTTYRVFAARSMTGVPVMPLGSMLPHGSTTPSTGVARCRCHRTLPESASSAYTVLFSVAT